MNLSMKNILFSIILTFAMVTFFGAGNALAYVTTSPYKLVGGINGQTFYVGDPGGSWASSIRSGVSAWNLTSTPAFYSEKSYSDQTLDFYVGNFGNTGWCGFTYYEDSYGITINYGGYPTKNWYSNYVNINAYYSYSQCAVSKKSIAAHEMGHSMGLKHASSSAALMYPEATKETPQSDDIAGINALY